MYMIVLALTFTQLNVASDNHYKKKCESYIFFSLHSISINMVLTWLIK